MTRNANAGTTGDVATRTASELVTSVSLSVGRFESSSTSGSGGRLVATTKSEGTVTVRATTTPSGRRAVKTG